MAFRGITFASQAVTSSNDAHIYKLLLEGRKGKTIGCSITNSTDEIYISTGYFFASNRLVQITSPETIITPAISSGTAYCRLVFEIDLSQTNTTESFNQGSFKILQSSSAYPNVVQEDLESGGNIYQLPFASFTKTISGIGSFVVDLESVNYITGNKTIYVTTSGNDASGDGSQTSPFASIQHAIDSIPKDLKGYEITINIASGTYTEDVVVSGFNGGSIRFTLGAVKASSFSVYESAVIITGTSLTLTASGKTYGFYVHRGSNVICQVTLTSNGSTYGVYATYGSRLSCTKQVTCNSCTYALAATNAGQAYISGLAGSLNNNAIQASAGIVHCGSVASGIASTVYVTSYGGRIYIGAQASVPSY